jgi:hypothetical protein
MAVNINKIIQLETLFITIPYKRYLFILISCPKELLKGLNGCRKVSTTPFISEKVSHYVNPFRFWVSPTNNRG